MADVRPYTLEPNTFSHTDVRLREGDILIYHVRAETAVGVYVVDSQNLAALIGGQVWKYARGRGRLVQHDSEFEVPYTDTWSLIVWNRHEHASTAVTAEIEIA